VIVWAPISISLAVVEGDHDRARRKRPVGKGCDEVGQVEWAEVRTQGQRVLLEPRWRDGEGARALKAIRWYMGTTASMASGGGARGAQCR